MGCSKIVAERSTITGSIGVVTGKFNLAGLYEKLGYNKEVLSRCGNHEGGGAAGKGWFARACSAAGKGWFARACSACCCRSVFPLPTICHHRVATLAPSCAGAATPSCLRRTRWAVMGWGPPGCKYAALVF